jgi:hypothetical protein
MLKRNGFLFLIGMIFCVKSVAQSGVCQSFQSFIPKHYQLLDSMSGDINQDGCKDLVLILASTRNYDRPLLLLEGNGTGKYFLAARNDSVILCEGCGGSCCHDPYQQTTITNSSFSFMHYGGDLNVHWTRLIAFGFDVVIQQYVLYKDIAIFKDDQNPRETRYVIYGKGEECMLPFSQYTYNKY